MTKKVVKPVQAAVQKVAIYDQMEVAKQALFTAARQDETIPIPPVLANALPVEGGVDVLLVVWRAWNIYATHSPDGWVMRADRK